MKLGNRIKWERKQEGKHKIHSFLSTNCFREISVSHSRGSDQNSKTSLWRVLLLSFLRKWKYSSSWVFKSAKVSPYTLQKKLNLKTMEKYIRPFPRVLLILNVDFKGSFPIATFHLKICSVCDTLGITFATVILYLKICWHILNITFATTLFQRRNYVCDIKKLTKYFFLSIVARFSDLKTYLFIHKSIY